jgi:hypothetical protein
MGFGSWDKKTVCEIANLIGNTFGLIREKALLLCKTVIL